MRRFALLITVLLTGLAACGPAAQAKAPTAYAFGKCKTRDFWKAAVPDADTAIAIAESVSAAQGFRPIAGYRPFMARQDGAIWRVTARKKILVLIDRCDGTVTRFQARPH